MPLWKISCWSLFTRCFPHKCIFQLHKCSEKHNKKNIINRYYNDLLVRHKRNVEYCVLCAWSMTGSSSIADNWMWMLHFLPPCASGNEDHIQLISKSCQARSNWPTSQVCLKISSLLHNMSRETSLSQQTARSPCILQRDSR